MLIRELIIEELLKILTFAIPNKELRHKFRDDVMNNVKEWGEPKEFNKTVYTGEDVSKVNFDVALIGAGAYGIFLAHHCKMLGKQGIHLGGQTQLLFGIRGYRWDKFFPEWYCNANLEHWIWPDDNEKPKGFEKVEDGCYW